MFHVSRPRLYRLLAAGVFLLLVRYDALGASAMSAPAWDDCRDRVIANLEAAGLRDFGDVSAYTGATGTGALQAVIDRCGYRSEDLDPAFCDDLYEQVYAACREDGFEGMSMAATSWVLIFDPKGPLVERLRRICIQRATIDRTRFGRLICGE
ncbi:hypothetical protein [Thiocapsa bogorovii]|jgi:hypothetical protein|uniref:hypothetical protein n=1 Tax=Thiocapsa bogorovii TaxID=521689 RepID=UPI001E29B532|nr:hypothetical protein [Thiocapsa bogorovii]UHD16020.1 hypothetical protein LT988_22675 [Thiocapsa bogorovii]